MVISSTNCSYEQDKYSSILHHFMMKGLFFCHFLFPIPDKNSGKKWIFFIREYASEVNWLSALEDELSIDVILLMLDFSQTNGMGPP